MKNNGLLGYSLVFWASTLSTFGVQVIGDIWPLNSFLVPLIGGMEINGSSYTGESNGKDNGT